MKKLALALCVGMFAVAGVRAADVGGTWDVDGDVVGNPVKFATVWKQDGDKLSGTATLEGKDVPVSGSVKENAVTFEFDNDYQGTTYHLVFSGTLGDDAKSLKGSIAVAGVDGTFSAKKE